MRLLRGLFWAVATVATGGIAAVALASDLQPGTGGCDGGADDDG